MSFHAWWGAHMNNTVEERSISCVSPTAVSNIQVSPTYNFQIFNLSKKKKTESKSEITWFPTWIRLTTSFFHRITLQMYISFTSISHQHFLFKVFPISLWLTKYILDIVFLLSLFLFCFFVSSCLWSKPAERVYLCVSCCFGFDVYFLKVWQI